MTTQANAEEPARKLHYGRHEAFGRDHDTCEPGGWGRGDGAVDLFDRRFDLYPDRDQEWDPHGVGRQHHRGPVTSLDTQSDAPSDVHSDPHSQPEHGMIAVLGGGAAAAGESTAVTGLVANFAEDRGDYSIARGEAIFEASAYSCEPGGAVAVADTFLDVSGADFVFAHETEQSKQGLNEAWARSELDYFAIDIEGWSLPQGPIVFEMAWPFACDPVGGPAAGQELPFGNLAKVLATAEAHGVDGISATLTDALTVENQFSFVQATGLVAL